MKVLFVGLGSIGQRHMQLIKRQFPDFELYALRSSQNNMVIRDGKARQVDSLEEYYGFKTLTTLSSALRLKPGAVFITNPTHLHLEYALAFAKKGCHLFIEKPISHTLNGIHKLIDTCYKKKVIIFVAYQQRFNPIIEKVKQIVDANISKIITAAFEWNTYVPAHHPYEDYSKSYVAKTDTGGGAILALSHELDLISYLFGLPSSTISAGGKYSDLNITAEDTLFSILTYPSFLVSLNLSLAQTKEVRKFKIQFTDKTLFVNLIDNEYYYELYNSAGKLVERYERDIIRNDLFTNEHKHFFDCITKKKQTKSDIINGIDILGFSLHLKQQIGGKHEHVR